MVEMHRDTKASVLYLIKGASMGTHVFICYARVDQDFVRALAAKAVLVILVTMIMGCAARTEEFFLPDKFFIDRTCEAFVANPQVKRVSSFSMCPY